MHTALAHHDHSDPNFLAHVLLIRGNAICIGCTASKLFMHFILPLLLAFSGAFTVIGPNEWVLLAMFVGSGAVSARELIRGIPTNFTIVNAVPGLYQVGALLYVALQPSAYSFELRLGLATLLAVPQLMIYGWKVGQSREFTSVITKLTARTSMIVGLYFATIDLVSTAIISLSYILLSGIVFIKLRRFSSYRAGNAKIPVMHTLPATVLSRLENRDIIDKHRVVITRNAALIFVMFMLGMVSLISNSASSCDTSIQASTMAVVPFLGMSKTNFCPNCGDPVDMNEKFCDKCGFNLQNPDDFSQIDKRNQTTQNSGYQSRQNYGGGYSDSYSGGGYTGAAYTGRGQRRNYDRDQAMPFAVGAGIVILLIGWGFTGSLGLGILVGVLAFGGILLAASTDNCCAQYLIMDCCCDCICSIMAAGGNNRR